MEIIMYRSTHKHGDVPDNLPCRRYQVYPVDIDVPEHSKKWASVDKETIRRVFPDRLEAYCVLALLVAAEENQEWVGVTYDYLDRLAIGGLRLDHNKVAWKRFGKWIWSFGKSKELTHADILVLLTQGFIQLFWGSMKGLTAKGYVCIERHRIDHVDVAVFFPTARLINKFNCSLSS